MNYRESKAVNYSILSSLITSPKEVKAMIDGVNKRSSGFELGSIVDHLLTNDAPISDSYLIIENKLTDKLKDWATRCFEIMLTIREEDIPNPLTDTIILRARNEVEYDSRLKNETALQKFNDSGAFEYYSALEMARSSNRTIISSDSLEYAENLVISTQFEPSTAFYLDPSNFTKQFKQLELFAELWGIECKGKPDIVDVNESDKIVYIVDVKTYAGNFVSNFWKYHYYLQTPFYRELFKKCYPEYADYEYKYINVTIDTTGANKPEVYELCDDLVDWVLDRDILDGEAEKTTYFMDVLYPKYNKIPSIPELIIELKWHIQNDKWDHRYRYYELNKNMIG